MLPCGYWANYWVLVLVHRQRQKWDNKNVAHEAVAERVTDVLTTFWRHLWSVTEQMHGNMGSICFT